MTIEPQTVFIGLMDFLSIPLPSALLTWQMLKRERNLAERRAYPRTAELIKQELALYDIV